ncbi:MAG: S1/P1 Nuclease [Flavobacteriales bacterium]|nr:S1/P1 Nuclease [Flavobacteriales bacterium]
MLNIARIALLSILCIAPLDLFCWGFYGHKSINRMAVFTLPTDLMGFYKQHLEFVSAHAVDPDMRRYVVKEEAARHYIDIDHFGENPFDAVPREWNDAIDKYTEDTLQAYGIVPWHVERMYNRLVHAFKEKDIPYILKTSADIGHYIADAHVPLHTTENYNGQMTNQHGIHGFWESRLPELYAEDYDYFVGKAKLIDRPLDVIWDAVEESHNAVDSVLEFERALTEEFPSDRKYAFEERGRSTVKVYSRDFSAEYHVMLNHMVERRMRDAIISVGSFWYSAWVEAGKPDLDKPIPQEQLDRIEEERKELEAAYKVKPVKSREHDE